VGPPQGNKGEVDIYYLDRARGKRRHGHEDSNGKKGRKVHSKGAQAEGGKGLGDQVKLAAKPGKVKEVGGARHVCERCSRQRATSKGEESSVFL